MSSQSFIPFGRPSFGEDEIEAVTRVLRNGWVGMGPETLAFERELAGFMGAPHVVAVSSCTGALFLALLIHGVGPGDEVICPSLTWCSTPNAALYHGARPVFCDVDPETLLVTPEAVLAKLTPATKAVVPVHYGGLAMDVAELRERLPPHVAIIEDAAHAFGARLPDGRMMGASGNLTCFSFYANKNLSTGEGGAIATHDPAVAARLVSLRLHALAHDAWQRLTNPAVDVFGAGLGELGYKLNYTDLQASIGRVQLRRHAEFAEHRLAIARYYVESLGRLCPELRFQGGVASHAHSRHLFVVILPERMRSPLRERMLTDLRNRGIGVAVHYMPLHPMPLYAPQEPLPITEDVASRIMTLPISASMTDDDARRVVEVFAEVFERHGREVAA